MRRPSPAVEVNEVSLDLKRRALNEEPHPEG